VIITAAGGKPLTNAYAKSLLKNKDVIIICGRYEGIDARAKKVLKAEEVSVGDYILTGGEVPALAIIDAAARQIPGVLGKFESLEESRVASHEIYTRPEVLKVKGKSFRVPKVLLSGNHAKMNEWKEKKRSNPSAK
jgi:tRNA (guanine37-N1)-methyltransferase